MIENATVVPLTRGYEAIIDAADAEEVLSHRWHAALGGRNVYAKRNVRLPDGRWTALLLHSSITGWDYVDHINGNGLDNRRSNLRQATHAENMHNSRLRVNNSSGFKGVAWYENRQKWRARIWVNGKWRNIGYYLDRNEAARAFDAAARECHGEYASLNFPGPGERGAR